MKFRKGVWGKTSLFGDSRADIPLTSLLLVRIRNIKGMSAKTEASVPNLLNLSTEFCGSVQEGASKQFLFFKSQQSMDGPKKIPEILVLMSDIRI
jgi:hypothetical protein